MLVTLWTWTLYAIPGKIYDFDTEFHSLCELSPDQLLGPLKVLYSFPPSIKNYHISNFQFNQGFDPQISQSAKRILSAIFAE